MHYFILIILYTTGEKKKNITNEDGNYTRRP